MSGIQQAETKEDETKGAARQSSQVRKTREQKIIEETIKEKERAER